ncbi:MAG: SUMF1/EgtB/PvdO family nonheme iron enzyme [Myxococcota bacterium]|nr:SUMF1/EgtB/PvdO family nonheme iron enzyme [Myxococcota bacterium]
MPFWTGNGSSLGGYSSGSLCSGTLTIQDGSVNPLLSDEAWFCGNSNGRFNPVGMKKSNGFGLCDMHGNLWEWTAEEVLRGGWWGTCLLPFVRPVENPTIPMGSILTLDFDFAH